MSIILQNLINENKNLIYGIAHRYKGYYSLDDLYQAGVLGLIKAYKNYNNNLGVKFSSYAYPYIMGEIILFIQGDRTIKVSKDYPKIYKRYEKIKNSLALSLGRTPRFSEIAKFMGMNESELLNIIESVLFVKNLENEAQEINNNYYVDERQSLIERITLETELENLDEFDRNIINFRYYQGYNQSQTAEALGVSQAKVSRQEKLVLAKIRNNIAA